MSLFGATTTFKKAVARARAEEKKKSIPGSVSSGMTNIASEESSHISGLLDEITGPLTLDEPATERSDLEKTERELHGDSEYERLRDEEKQAEFEAGLRYARVEDDLRRREDSQATSRVETGQLPSDLGEI